VRVEFVDTSILVEMLDVPDRNANRDAVLAQFKAKRHSGIHFILPTASVIETGNHVHHIKEGSARLRCAEAFADLLRLTAAGQAPWTLFESIWDGEFLTAIRSGARTSTSMVEHCVAGTLSCGDLTVMAERDVYRSRVAKTTDVRIWTLDVAMQAWA
jgi:hypothetical protein